MALPSYIQKTLHMKPEVSQIFTDLEAWHDHCRFNMLPFNPADLYKSKQYKEWIRENNRNSRYDKPRRDQRSAA